MPFRLRSSLRTFSSLFAVFVLIALALLQWGSDLLTAVDPMPAHVDAAVALQGSIVAEKVRIAGAVSFLQNGIADRVLIGVPKESYWGQSIPPVARAYLQRTYGESLASRVDFCETSADVNSTEQEAEVTMNCIRDHKWRSIAIVTSDYHTRRARILWRRTTQQDDPTIHFSMESVADPEFQKPWWRHRHGAKIWLGESLKLLWTVLGGK
jgi:uncharacterized SAM-binding protein YcdF (DUF218 family)